MNLVYTDGPPIVKMGKAGIFKKDEPREVTDKLAEQLLKKKMIKFKKADGAAPAKADKKGGK